MKERVRERKGVRQSVLFVRVLKPEAVETERQESDKRKGEKEKETFKNYYLKKN